MSASNLCRRWQALAASAALVASFAAYGSDLGIGGVQWDMSPDQVAAVLDQQKQRVFSRSAHHVESIVADSSVEGSVRARFIFDESLNPRLGSVEFVADDDKATHQYIAWYTKLTGRYGSSNLQLDDGSLRSTFCHSRDIAVVLALFDHRTVMAYLHGTAAAACQKSNAHHAFPAVAYDWRPADAQSSLTQPVAARPMAAQRHSPLAYAPQRSQRYQDTLRCIGVAYWRAAQSSGGEQVRWKGTIQNLSRTLVGIGQGEGLSMQQVDREGHQVVGVNVTSYQQGRKDGSQSYLDLDQAYCRALGMLSE